MGSDPKAAILAKILAEEEDGELKPWDPGYGKPRPEPALPPEPLPPAPSPSPTPGVAMPYAPGAPTPAQPADDAMQQALEMKQRKEEMVDAIKNPFARNLEAVKRIFGMGGGGGE